MIVEVRIFFLISISISILHLNGFTQTIVVKPYLQDVSDSGAKIMFETNSGTTAFVHFGTSPFDLHQIEEATSQTGNGSSRIFTALIPDLSDHQKYYYKVVLGNGVQSNVYHFTTLALPHKEQNINFVSMSDMQRQGGQSNIYYNIINNGIIPIMDAELEGGLNQLHGILIPGDLVQSGGTYAQWKNDFFDQGENLNSFVPLYPSIGNHEYYNDGLPNYLKYFDLPLNGHPNFPEQWWYKDFSNIRVIALNSNSNAAEKTLQITWLNNVLNSICTDSLFDFVFVQLHHPFKSELWTPGESSFTGQVIHALENFSTNCGKPSIHLFGHTHGYSRGQSKFHNHLWINVATAGGAIDYWGQYPNHDYDEFSHSEDEYGFVLLKGQAGPDPEIQVTRYTRGDDYFSLNNFKSDSITLKKFDYPPQKPVSIWPTDTINFNCTTLKAGAFFDPDNFHQASQWQVSSLSDFSVILQDVWRQHENLYNNTDTQIGDDLTDEDNFVFVPGNTYFWRVRYRDNFLRWSEWSDPMMIVTRATTTTNNLLQNGGAEDGINYWTGQIESLTSNQCNSVPVYLGNRFFGVGGICANEQNLGLAEQYINVTYYSSQIDDGELHIWYGGYLRTWAVNNDLPEISVDFINGSGQVISSTPFSGNNQPVWTLVQQFYPIPPLTRRIKFILRGTRLGGGDNDSYFDEMFVKLTNIGECPTCYGNSGIDLDNDGFCSDIDCNDNNVEIHPGAPELCDGIDNNCDGKTDSGINVFWTGNGDGYSWNDDMNWNQMMVPLPCQHVFIQTQDTVFIEGYESVKSLTIGSLARCEVMQQAMLRVDSQNETNTSGLTLQGVLFNFGRVDIENSSMEGIIISGSLSNYGRIYINGIQASSVLSTNGSTFENQGLIKLKD